MSGRSRFMPGDVVPLIAAHDAREAVALDAQFGHAQNLTPMGQIDDTRLAVWTCPGCMYDQPTDRVETICDCVSIIACWCDGVTECPPCASSGNRPHICATAEQRAEYQPTEPDYREAD